MKVTVNDRNAADRKSYPYLGRFKSETSREGSLVLVVNALTYVSLSEPFVVGQFAPRSEKVLIERLPPGYAVTLIQD